MIWWWLLACGQALEPVQLVEAWDVPPPPGQATVEFTLSWQPALGQTVSLTGPGTLAVDVVDVNPAGGRYTVTGYAAEDAARKALATSGWKAPLR